MGPITGQEPACFSAKSPITGSLKRSLLYALKTNKIQSRKIPSRTTQKSIPIMPQAPIPPPTTRIPNRMLIANQMTKQAMQKKSAWKEWKRTNERRLNGSISRKTMLMGNI